MLSKSAWARATGGRLDFGLPSLFVPPRWVAPAVPAGGALTRVHPASSILPPHQPICREQTQSACAWEGGLDLDFSGEGKKKNPTLLMGCSSPSLCRLQRDRECDIWSPSFYVENEMSQIPAAALKMEEKTRSLCVLIFKVMVKKKTLKNAKLPSSSLHSKLEPLFFCRNNCYNKCSIVSLWHDLVRFSFIL